MNAISTELLDELNLALDEIESDQSVRVVVLTGTGRAFCAGADLKAIANAAGEIDPSQVVEFVSYAGRTIERLAALAQPVIAGVNGLALAGGLELLLASDIVVASSAARIGDALEATTMSLASSSSSPPASANPFTPAITGCPTAARRSIVRPA